MNTNVKPKIELKDIHFETLCFLYNYSPIWCGDFPSKKARDELEELGYAKNIPIKGEGGYWVLTYEGNNALTSFYAGTLKERLVKFESDKIKRRKHLETLKDSQKFLDQLA